MGWILGHKDTTRSAADGDTTTATAEQFMDMAWTWFLPRQTNTPDEDTVGGGGEGEANDAPESIDGTKTTTSQATAPTGNGASPGGNDGDDKPVIEFADFTGDRIFEEEDYTLRWTIANDTITVDSVSWKGSKTNEDIDDTIATTPNRNGRFPDRKPLTSVSSTALSGQGKLSFEDFFSSGNKFKDYRAHGMVIRIDWTIDDDDNQNSGFSESGAFTVGKAGEDDAALAEFQETLRDNEKLRDGTQVISGTNDNDVSRPSSTVSGASTTATSSQTDDSDAGEGGGGGGGGLSTGAIAGIAVGGAVVFLALLGGLIFFFLRRRRRNKDRGQYNNPDTSTTFMAGDKEVHQVTESPHSTYSNDQQVPLSNLAAAGGSSSHGAGGPSGHHHHHDDDDADYAPYRDDDASPTSPASGRARDDGAGTPHGVSRSVAHLVEEGMTEAEIRRLEEEERQLDDAIERHGHR